VNETPANRPLEFSALEEPREITVEWAWQGDDATPGRYIAQLADALWRHQNAENFATLAALVVACEAVSGDNLSRYELDHNEAWRLAAFQEQR
jgi:hypothetical protein